MQAPITKFYNQKKIATNSTILNKVNEKVATNPDEIENILIKFDLDPKYGPCRGITRSQRFELAQKYKLNPPQEVKAMIKELGNEKAYYDRFI